MNLKPLGGRVIVRPNEDDEQRTSSGLVIPDTAKEKPQTGTIMAVGPGDLSDDGERIPLDVSEGDVVVYSKFGGTELKHEGDEYLILSSRDLLAIRLTVAVGQDLEERKPNGSEGSSFRRGRAAWSRVSTSSPMWSR